MQASPLCVSKPASKSSVMIGGGGGDQFNEAAGKQLNCLKEQFPGIAELQMTCSRPPGPFPPLLDPVPIIRLYEWSRCEH